MNRIKAKFGSLAGKVAVTIICGMCCILADPASTQGQTVGLKFKGLSTSDITSRTNLEEEPGDEDAHGVFPPPVAMDRTREFASRKSVAKRDEQAIPAGGQAYETFGAPLPGELPDPAPISAPPVMMEMGGGSNPAPAAPSNSGAAASSGPNMPYKSSGSPLTPRFGNGFELQTEDKEFSIQFHNLTHVDGRFFEQGDQRPVADTFAFPRQWFIFNGTVGKPYEYFVALAHGFNNFTLLDAYFNVHFNDATQFKVGRFKTPFAYEFYALSINGLVTPERSLFFNNFGLNRDIGAMLWGTMWDKQLDYAAGIFNGSKNGFLDTNDEKDLAAYVNWKPFVDQKDSLFQNLQFGGSVNYGNQYNDANPAVLRLLTPTPGNAVAGVPFLAYNSGVIEQGERVFWSAHAAWYAGPLSLHAEYQSGYQSMATSSTAPRTKVGVDSFYVTAGWFLTGESVTGRGIVKPNQNFDLREGKEGCGAVELFTRYNLLDIDNNVFAAGLADPTKWTNRVQTIDVGFHWYWSPYVRWTFGWQRGLFGSPVEFASGRAQMNSDEFIARCQVSF